MCGKGGYSVLSRLIVSVLTFVVLASGATAAGAQDDLPPKRQWLDDVRTALTGSRTYVDDRVSTAGQHRLALNLDIDNTSLSTYYAPGQPVPAVLGLARYAVRHGVAVLFNTGRAGDRVAEVRRQLTRAGYDITELCSRETGEALVVGKQRCRQHFIDEGYTLIANIGNRSTDFIGDGYERSFRLPSYSGRLG